LIFVLAGAAGLILGSFFTVLIHRLPTGCSMVSPGSACLRCHAPLSWLQKVPVLSYAALRGRCAACRSPISPMYPFMEISTAVILTFFAWCAGVFEGGRLAWERAGIPLFAATLVPVVVIDYRHRIIPDEISLALMAIGFVQSILPGNIGALQSILGFLTGGGFLYLTAIIGERLFHKEGMGGGDIKLLASFGALLGPWPLVSVLLVASFTALVYVAAQGPPFRGRQIPFGPFLALGLWMTLFLLFRTGWLGML
jgi:leader peptidase (prepilin peptidase)/N-methyltransferase